MVGLNATVAIDGSTKRFKYVTCSGYSPRREVTKCVFFQFIVNRGGEVGLTYEHSPAEGQPIAVMMDHMVNFM